MQLSNRRTDKGSSDCVSAKVKITEITHHGNCGCVVLWCRSDEEIAAMTGSGTVANAAFTVLDVTKIPAKEGQARCPRCSGAVFQAESMPCRGRVSTTIYCIFYQHISYVHFDLSRRNAMIPFYVI